MSPHPANVDYSGISSASVSSRGLMGGGGGGGVSISGGSQAPLSNRTLASSSFVHAVRNVQQYQRLEKKRQMADKMMRGARMAKRSQSSRTLRTSGGSRLAAGGNIPGRISAWETSPLMPGEKLEPLHPRDISVTSIAGTANDVSENFEESGHLVIDDIILEDRIADEKPTIWQVIWHMISGKGIISWCLLAAPFAIWAEYGGWGATAVFWLNFLVMIPLASILGDFTEELALHTNETIGGLINASFGNAVEVVVAIQALLANEIRVVQASMLGSIFSNLLLVLGSCFFFGGMKHSEQRFNATAATANMGLLGLSSIALVLPTPFAQYYDLQDKHVLVVSRIAAVFLMFMYVQLLVFQLHTHAYIFDEGAGGGHNHDGNATNGAVPPAVIRQEHYPTEHVMGDIGGNKEFADDASRHAKDDDDADDDAESASIPFWVAMAGLLTTTLLVTVFSEYLVGSIDGFTKASGISQTFVGIILLPIVGNAVEHVTAITVAMKDKMDLAMGVAVGSCTQISLFVTPLTVLVGWMLDRDMTLNFPHFEIILYILSVLTVSIVLSNPVCNWLEGSLLITTYLLIAVGFWYENVRKF